MKLVEISNKELTDLRTAYMRDLRTETQASASVRRTMKIIIEVLNEALRARNGGSLPVLDARRMARPGDEPLA